MSLDAQSSPRVVRSGWPPLVQEWAEPRFVEPVTESVRVVVDPASEHIAAGRAQIVRFANESQVALTQLRAWLRADRNDQYERTLGDVIYDIEGVLEHYDQGGS